MFWFDAFKLSFLNCKTGAIIIHRLLVRIKWDSVRIKVLNTNKYYLLLKWFVLVVFQFKSCPSQNPQSHPMPHSSSLFTSPFLYCSSFLLSSTTKVIHPQHICFLWEESILPSNFYSGLWLTGFLCLPEMIKYQNLKTQTRKRNWNSKKQSDLPRGHRVSWGSKIHFQD